MIERAKTKTVPRGSKCQACGFFRRVAGNGRLPPHKCVKARPPMPKSPDRKVIVVSDDDDLSAYIRQVCYGTSA